MLIRRIFTLLCITALLGFISGAAAYAVNVKSLKDDTYVVLTGRVGTISDDTFVLDYGNGTIQVNTNGYWPALLSVSNPDAIIPGDKVTVTGLVDKNLFNKRSIDATSIGHKGKAYTRVFWHTPYTIGYYGYSPYRSTQQQQDNTISVSGSVTRVLNDNTFEMQYGDGTLRVKTDEIIFPDAQNLNIGDRVTVLGTMDENWFGKQKLEADRVILTHVYHARG